MRAWNRELLQIQAPDVGEVVVHPVGREIVSSQVVFVTHEDEWRPRIVLQLDLDGRAQLVIDRRDIQKLRVYRNLVRIVVRDLGHEVRGVVRGIIMPAECPGASSF